MTRISAGGFESKIHPILGSVRSTAVPEAEPSKPRIVLPFVTISRQAGAGGRSLANAVVEKLNAIDPAERPWEAFDRELVERVAADLHVSEELISSLEDTSHTWLDDFFTGLPGAGKEWPSELKIWHRVVATVRALAQAGRVVLVGCGSSYITHEMPGGMHVRLVARLQHRVATMARLEGLSLDDAARRVRQVDQNRAAFYKRYWPDRPLSAEEFTITLNSSALSEAQMVSAIVPLVVPGAAR